MKDGPILLVEDNLRDDALTKRVFLSKGIRNEIVVAKDGPEALDYLFGTGAFKGRDTSMLPRFVLLDLNLPKLNGFELLKKIREDERTQVLPVIIFSSSTRREDEIKAYQLGANSFVRKPLGFENFSKVVGRIGRYWLSTNELPDRR